MGRELRRKQAKKDGKSLKQEVINEKNQIKSLIIITIVLVAIIGIIYLLSALFVTKELKWFEKDDIVIIAGKGHENYQIIGKVKHHFDDKEIAQEFLNNK